MKRNKILKRVLIFLIVCVIIAFIHQESYLFATLFLLILIFEILLPNFFKKNN